MIKRLISSVILFLWIFTILLLCMFVVKIFMGDGMSALLFASVAAMASQVLYALTLKNRRYIEYVDDTLKDFLKA